MKLPTTLAFGALSFTVLSPSLSSAAVLSYDDGETDTSFGSTGPLNAIWMVRYNTPAPGISQVTEVSAVFGSLADPGSSGGNGQALTFGVWSDPNGDGNPSDGLLLGSGAGATALVDNDLLVTFTLSTPVTINTTQFFVGYFLPVNNTFPVGYDSDNPLPATSWAFIGTNINTLSANGAPVDLNTLGAGVSIIRATVVPEPSTMAALGAAGLLAAGRRRRKA